MLTNGNQLDPTKQVLEREIGTNKASENTRWGRAVYIEYAVVCPPTFPVSQHFALSEK